jgi:preprotein translocase subunit SecA
MEADDLTELVTEFRRDTVADLVNRHLPPKAYAEQWDIAGLDERVRQTLGLELPLAEWAAEEGVSNEEIEERIQAAADKRADERTEAVGSGQMKSVEKSFLLQMIDYHWREHLVHLDHLRSVIGLRGYGQRDPLNEYKTEAFTLFERLLTELRQGVTAWLMNVEFRFEQPPQPTAPEFEEIHINPLTGENEAGRLSPAATENMGMDERAGLPHSALPAGWERTARNAPCPCGSERKFKHCHGALI